VSKKFESGKLGEGIYTAKDASLIFNIPYPKVNYWFQWYLKKGKFNTNYQYHFSISNKVAVNFLTLIEMYVFYSLKENGVKTKTIIEAHEILANQFKTQYPFAQKEYYSLGDNVFFEDSNILTTANKNLQGVFPEALIPYSKKISFGNDKLAHKFYPLGETRSIIIDPNHQFGQPTIKGTNILAATIYDWHLSNESEEFIADLYNISIQNIRDSVDFYKTHKIAA
jgi:uncharacterized protein (DUF433 family)